MKTLITAALLLFFSLTSSWALTLNKNFTDIILDSTELQVYVDKDNLTTVEKLINRDHHYFATGDKNSFPYSNASIWSKATLTNHGDGRLSLYLINDFAAHDEVDIYLIKNGTISREFFFGDSREVPHKSIINRFANIHINLEKNETLEVVTRYHSTTPISIKTTLLNEQEYANFAIKDLSIWGIFIGITLALAIYNFMMFLSLKNIAFLFYVLHSLTNLYNTLTSSGHIYAFLSPVIPLSYLSISYKITPSLAVIFMSLFIITFFELKERVNWLYKLNLANACLFGALIISLYFFYISDNLIIHNQISAMLLPIALILMLISALIIAFKRLFSGLFFLFGAGIFFTTMLTYVLYYTGLVDFSSSIIYALPIGMAAEAILFSMALGQKIKRIEAERFENALLVEESNKFNSTSSLLAGILHQFKQPLIYLGAEVLNLKTERFKAKAKATETDRILNHMEDHISAMNDLVGNFFSFYSQEAKISVFKLENAFNKVLDILDSSIEAYGIRIENVCQDIRIKSNEKTLTHIFLILLENAITILKERNIEQPTIYISSKIGSQIEISIRDNAGGVAAENIDKIFNIHYSNRQSKGLGIGLSLARKLAEDKLNGRLVVNNDDQGACFTLTFLQGKAPESEVPILPPLHASD